MTQAQSRRLRTSCLLLLLLLVAGMPLLSVAATSLPATATASFAIEGLTTGTSVPAGVALRVTVTAKTMTGTVDPDYAGTIQFSSTAPRALLPARYTFNPSVDRGSREFLVTFQSYGLWELLVQDLNTPTIKSHVPSITVTPGPPVRFTVALDSATVAGTGYTLQVLPVDASGNRTDYTGRVHFETTVLRAVLPPDTDVSFTAEQATPLEFPITFLSASPELKTLTVTDVTGQNLTGSASTVVSAGPFARVKLFTTSPDPTPTCSEATLVLKAEDAWENPVTEVPAATVTLCTAPGSSATFVRSTLERAVYSPPCVRGTLASISQVVWKNTKPEDVEFTVSGVAARAPLTLHFQAGTPSAQTSSFSFSESTTEPAALLLRSGQLTAQLTLRDQCGDPATLPAGKLLSFAANPPLSVTPPVEEAPGRWKTSVSLPECPSDASKTLAVWPLIDNEVLKKPSGEQVKRLVLAQCSTLAKLSVLTSADSLVAEPGELVEFEVEVSTEGDLTLTSGVLMLEPQGLTVTGASSSGQALPARGGGFELPELRKGSPLTVKVTAQTTTQLQQTVGTKVWVVDPEGALLTQMERVDFQQKDLGVDVGCGCHTGGLPGQLATWLALLGVASRQRGGLRRLRRGERIDP
ncbi:hypothetical protein ATI61_10419 [Archangium gephyra]|uniref:Co/Zn/Cd efflux system membrane fusion protein n=1 Tax=Archangium gephyra TaxID=48 RepID=A0AAC8TDI9_9BACT|nr:hypothetical protein [Archangium gephyra]AKJ00571.1 Putative Co/Zn/Cd efflux system membrane fusion protein [Archangium gephyra]REG32732.1 hypothetical protein ATI61_10419 [Archangium gephyra]